MRVIHLADYGGSYPGSFVPMMRAVHDAAAQRGWSFEALFTPIAATRSWYAQMAEDGLAVRTTPSRDRRKLAAWLRNVLGDRGEPTVLHTHFTTFDVPAVAGAFGSPNVRVFWHLHSRFESGLRATVGNATRFAVAGRRVEAILCVSDDLRENARRRLAPARHLMVFPNAIDLQRFAHATAQERTVARAELGVPADRPLLVHFGWHWDTKGGDLFLETIAHLSHIGVEVTGVTVGGGDPARATIKRLGIEDRVLVSPPRDDVRSLYAAADVFVSSSRAEGAMSFALLEALAMGTPVVASMIPNHVVLAERTNGCTLAEREPQAFARSVRSVLSARSEGRVEVDMSELSESLDLKAWAERLMDLYAHTRR